MAMRREIHSATRGMLAAWALSGCAVGIPVIQHTAPLDAADAPPPPSKPPPVQAQLTPTASKPPPVQVPLHAAAPPKADAPPPDVAPAGGMPASAQAVSAPVALAPDVIAAPLPGEPATTTANTTATTITSTTVAPLPAPAADPQALPRIVVFGRDAYLPDPGADALLRAHAEHLRADPRLRLLLKGHGDARGSVHYNQALAAKRAEVVARALRSYGVAAWQLTQIAIGDDTDPDGPDVQRVVLIYR
jgi:outer membrane protein OmpA-like peptidoglycan-associated protein